MTLDTRLAARARDRKPSPIRELMPFLSIPGMVSLGGGYPNPETFAIRELALRFKSGRTHIISNIDATTASQYGPTPAHRQLGSTLRAWHTHKDGVSLQEDEYVVLNGSQEGLFIMAYLFLEKDDCVALAEPAYPGATSAISSFCRNFITVGLDDQGMKTDELERALQDTKARGGPLPKYVYTVPSGHNPGGVTLSLPRRRHLLELADRYDFLILEDDPYQLVQLDAGATPLPTIQSLEETRERVIRLDSFSKIFAPGLRIGYMSGPAEITRQFVLFKQCSNLHTSMLVQALLHAYLCAHDFEEFRREIVSNCELYRRNRDAMIDSAAEFLPKTVRYNVPRHGMFLWFELPRGYNTNRMIRLDAEDLKVLLVPGDSFAIHSDLRHCMRASFSMVDPAQIRDGMRRFADMISREQERMRGEEQ